MAAVPRLSWMNCTRRASWSSFSTTEACEMPTDASKKSDFTINGNCSFRERVGFWRRRTTVNSGTGMRW
jgi:hypothetical protein